MKILLKSFIMAYIYFSICHTQVIYQTTPENKISFLYDLQSKKYDSQYRGYNILKTHDTTDSAEDVYSLIISRNDSIKFRTKVGVEDSSRVSYVIYPLIPNGRKQIIIEEHTGGAHCCHLYWILDLGDTIRILYHSNENETEIGALMWVFDYDNDGYFEFSQYLNSFHYFDKLSGAGSPGVYAIYKYSIKLGIYVLANSDYPTVNLERIEEIKSDVKEILDSTKEFDYEDSENLLSKTLEVLIDYIYAGQENNGWLYFDKYYVLPDKIEMKEKIHRVLEASVVYKEIYKK